MNISSQKKIKQPSFFIIGAPKCGTTALCKYLNCHPDIFIPTIKELHYFDSDLKTKKHAKNLEEYLSFFAGQGHKLCGEGSPTYLYSERAASNIYSFNPQAKIIIMLRNPVDIMYAFHSQHLFNGSSEDIQDFKLALDMENERKQGQNIPVRCQESKILFYRDFARYFQQISKYLAIFDQKQIKI